MHVIILARLLRYCILEKEILIAPPFMAVTGIC